MIATIRTENDRFANEFEFLLFSVDPAFIEPAVRAGLDGIIVDWENRNKEARQQWADTQINHHTLQDLQRVRDCTNGLVICRINQLGQTTDNEIEQVISAGADEILLPMVRTVAEVEYVLDRIDGRCELGILIETIAAVAIAEELGRLPLKRIYVGLNDLGIERGTPNIFTTVADGTLDHIQQHVKTRFGFGGLTLPNLGHPIPCRLLIGAMARLNSNFSFLRRSFQRDTSIDTLDADVMHIRSALDKAAARDDIRMDHDTRELNEAIAAWTGPRTVRSRAAINPVGSSTHQPSRAVS